MPILSSLVVLSSLVLRPGLHLPTFPALLCRAALSLLPSAFPFLHDLQAPLGILLLWFGRVNRVYESCIGRRRLQKRIRGYCRVYKLNTLHTVITSE